MTAVLIDNQGVGKTTIVESFVEGSPSKYNETTIGSAFHNKKITVHDEQFNLQVWDTAGQERFRAMAPLCYKDADGIIMVCDITNSTSLKSLETWYSSIEDYAPENVAIVVGVNKIDLQDDSEITIDDITAF